MTVPKTVVVPLLRVEKLTVPTPLAGVTATVKLTLVPTLTLVEETCVIAIELPVRDPPQAVKSLLASTDPRPVTWS